VGSLFRIAYGAAAAVLVSLLPVASLAAPCVSRSEAPLFPTDTGRCAELAKLVRGPKDQLDQYERNLAEYLSKLCHRDVAAGWKPDKRIRDTGPYVATFRDGKWRAAHYGTHPAVLVWYSRDMFDWLKRNRQKEDAPPAREPVPDGAMMIKEMFVPPASACADVTEWKHLKPTKGIALMIRDRQASHDGWFWGWFDWAAARANLKDWKPDWPADAKNPLANMGFGQYCTNCHASAKEYTFASLRNIAGERGEPLVFLSHDFFLEPVPGQHAAVATAGTAPPALAKKDDDAFVVTYGSAENTVGAIPPRANLAMPSETYDNVWMPAGGPKPSSQFLTSDQCIGCHDARGTGLQYDMTEPAPGDKLINISPYATWRSSPMGLSGRDPIFYAQLASETETFHRDFSAKLQDACLGCHGIGGQRQSAIDHFAASKHCEPFLRTQVDTEPLTPGARQSHAAAYAALARDGITCNACHQMALTQAERSKYAGAPQNACLAERQDFLTGDLKGFARTFTGSFFMTPPEVMYGPFENPKRASMKNAIGIAPEHNAHVRSSEVCGSCHVVHLPVLQRDKVVGHVYEQTTYAEWAFSDYRTGKTPDGELWRDQNCARLPNVKHHPHYETIDRQDQAQIYEKLVAAPAEVAPVCGSRAEPAGPMTTSFLSQCAKAKDNRILPHGFLPLSERRAIAAALGANEALAIEAGAREVRGDPDYQTGGADTLVYRVPLAGLAGKPATVAATLYYQATPPYYLQDRFCTAKSTDAARLYFTTRYLDLDGTAAQGWKLKVSDTGSVTVP